MSSTRIPQFVVRSSMSRSATLTFHRRGPGLAFLVDGQRDHRGAVLANQWHHALIRDDGPSPSS